MVKASILSLPSPEWNKRLSNFLLLHYEASRPLRGLPSVPRAKLNMENHFYTPHIRGRIMRQWAQTCPPPTHTHTQEKYRLLFVFVLCHVASFCGFCFLWLFVVCGFVLFFSSFFCLYVIILFNFVVCLFVVVLFDFVVVLFHFVVVLFHFVVV